MSRCPVGTTLLQVVFVYLWFGSFLQAVLCWLLPVCVLCLYRPVPYDHVRCCLLLLLLRFSPVCQRLPNPRGNSASVCPLLLVDKDIVPPLLLLLVVLHAAFSHLLLLRFLLLSRACTPVPSGFS